MGLVIALNKGRILRESLPILGECDIRPTENYETSRKLIFPTSRGGHTLLIVRGADVPTYVENGIADVGITGKDTILEYASAEGFYELLDLHIGKCRLMTAGPVGVPEPALGLRVATKFIRIAKMHYETIGKEVSVIKLSGAMEIAPALGLSDMIVDIVDSGNTLKANGLEERQKLFDISSRLIVNRASMKTKHHEIEGLTSKLNHVLETFL